MQEHAKLERAKQEHAKNYVLTVLMCCMLVWVSSSMPKALTLTLRIHTPVRDQHARAYLLFMCIPAVASRHTVPSSHISISHWSQLRSLGLCAPK